MLALKLPSLPPAPPRTSSSSEMRHPQQPRQQQQQQMKPPSLIHCRKNNNSLETSSSEEDLTAAAEDEAAAAAFEVMDQFETTPFIPRSSSLEASSRVLGGHAKSVPEEDEEVVIFIMAVWCNRNKEMF